MQQQITKEKWLAKTVEIQQIIKEKQTTDYKNVVKVWEGRNKDLKLLEKQQAACDNLNLWLEKVLCMIQEHTGKCLTIIVGGPELKSQGDMVMTCMHQGVTLGSHPIDFNTFATSLFTDMVIPKYIEFLKMVHSQNKHEKKYGLFSRAAPSMDVADTGNDVEQNGDDEVSHVNSNNNTKNEDVCPDGLLTTPNIGSTIGLNQDQQEDTPTNEPTANQNQQEDAPANDAISLNPSQQEDVPIDNSAHSHQNLREDAPVDSAISSTQTLQEDISINDAINSRGHEYGHDMRAKSGTYNL